MAFGLEATFAHIADIAPGFAGVYADSNHRTRVALVPGGDLSAAVAAIHAHFDHELPASLLQSMEPVVARYNYRQLLAWKDQLESEFGSPGPIGFAVHVTTNTIDVFSPSADVDYFIGQRARSDEIPMDAIRMLRTATMGPTVLMDLKSQFRPGVPGGVAISVHHVFPVDTVGCTLGINVKLTYNSPWVGLTAAHCSATIGGVADHSLVEQGGPWPKGNYSHLIGREIADVAWTTSGCPPIDGHAFGHCRYADVDVIGYDQSAVPDSGYIAITVKRDSNTIQWISKDSTSLLSTGYFDDQPWEGVEVDHVGVATGWRSGTVTESCRNLPVGALGYSGDYEFMCQSVVAGVAGKGDSGGPVFQRGPGKHFMFVGLLSQWVDDTVHYAFSSFPNLCQDLGGCPVVQWWGSRGF